MADVNSSKSRSALGEITNLPTKRGFPEIEAPEIKRSKLNKTVTVKQIRVNPLKANLSKLSIENKNVLGFGSNAGSKSLIDCETECNDGHCLIGENVVVKRSKGCDGSKVTNSLDFYRRTASQRINYLDVGKNGIAEGNALDTGIICNRDCKNSDSTGLGKERNANFDDFKKLDLMKGDGIATAAQVFSETMKHGSEGALEFGNVEGSDQLGDNTSRTVSDTGGGGLCGGKDFDAYESIAMNDYQNDGDDQNADNFVLSQSGSVDCMILPESQESRVFGAERSTELKQGYECVNRSDGTDSIKACSCSFCTKAAYIWLDLNYQDIKARVSALKKSQKEASLLAERSIRHRGIEKHIAESFLTVPNLECDLMQQWRSLFLQVGDLLKEENNHLEARLLPLADLREQYKADLDMTNAASIEKY